MSIITGPQTDHFSELAWDTEHFGFPVARIDAADLAESDVRAALRAAREQGQRLLYVFDAPTREFSAPLLRDFSGRLVDRKATFELDLTTAPELPDDPTFEILVYGDARADASLVSLAVAAGAYSRFQVDPKFPQPKFESMMQVWMQRLVRGEMADAVLVARQAGNPKNLALNAPLLSGGVGRSTLVAVAEEVRGRGLGTQIMAAAHRWMVRRGASRAVVCTQLDNVPACRLYQKVGYHLTGVEYVYHFWL